MKLIRPELGGVQALQGVNPGYAAQEGREFQQGMENIAQLGRSATSYFKQLAANEASTEMSLEYSREMNDIFDLGEFVTSDQARELGVEDEDVLSSEEEIPLWQVLPELAKKKYDELTDKYAEKIVGQKSRQEWVNTRRVQSERYYSELQQQRRDEDYKQRVIRQQAALAEAVQTQDWQLAIELANGHPDPEKRVELSNEVYRQRELAGVHRAYNSGDIGMMEDEINYLTSEDYDGRFTPVERTSNANMLKAEANRIGNEAKMSRFIQYEDTRKQYEVLKALKDPRAFEVLNTMEGMLVENGMLDYAPKGFFAEELGALVKMFANQQNLAYVDNAWMAGDYVGIDQTDPEHTNRINELVNTTIQMAQESGDPTAIRAVHAMHLDSATKTGVLPEFYIEKFRDLAQPNISTQHAQEYASFYNQIASSGHPNLLADMSDKDRAIANEVFLANRAGADMETALRDIHSRYRTMTDDAVRERETMYTDMEASRNDILGTQLRKRVKGWLASAPLVSTILKPFMEDAFAEISFQDQQDYNQLVRHNILNGAEPEVAFKTAFETWAANHTVSGVNGRAQRMRMAPEIMYGVETEALRDDLNQYLREAIDPEDYDPKGNYQIYPDMITISEQKPSYIVFREDSDGTIRMAADDYGNVLRYQPDKARINKASMKRDLDRARNLRELGYDPVKRTELLEKYSNPNMPRSRDERIQLGFEKTSWEDNMARNVEKAQKQERIQQTRLKVVNQRSQQMAEERKILRELDSQ